MSAKARHRPFTPLDKPAETKPTISVGRVAVRDLFGRYSYELPSDDSISDDLMRVFILYGGNGSGKTTVLRLIFHLLSPASNRGHRTFLASVPFRDFSVDLSDGHVVSAHRSGPAFVGTFKMTISLKGRVIAESVFEADAQNRLRASKDLDKQHAALLNQLGKLGIDLYYQSDTRELLSDRIDPVPDHSRHRQILISELAGMAVEQLEAALVDRQSLELERAIERTVEWAQQQALVGSNLGQANANTIYNEIVRRILKSPMNEKASKPDVDQLIRRLRAVSEKSEEFARYGLTSQVDITELVDLLQRAPNDKYPIVETVLRPYLDGIQARLAALQEIQDQVSIFVRSINSFYTDKRVDFDVRTGMKIVADDQVLAPTNLSSGERQLLLLFCNILYARNRKRIFLIDEPELSLNVRWQRNLIGSLLECSQGSSVQFLLATHSIELLASHRSHVVNLSKVDD